MFRRPLRAIRKLRTLSYLGARDVLARLLSKVVLCMTGIETRSDAQVVRGLFIHGTGVIIEETAAVEDDVALDHGTTLAGAGKE
jgi:serine acetyltransferase